MNPAFTVKVFFVRFVIKTTKFLQAESIFPGRQF